MPARKTKVAEIDPAALYRVELAAPIRVGRKLLRPCHAHQLRGVHVEAHRASISAFAPVEPAVPAAPTKGA